jgi:peroxiredoxin
MMKRLLLLTLAVIFTAAGSAEVVRKAPDVSWPGAGSKNRSLRSLHGQPVVILISDSPRTGAFRKQVKWLQGYYSELAAKGAVFVAAFRSGEALVKSDIPFIVANNGAAVASAYGVEGDFAMVVVGRDGNLDYITHKVRTGQRVRDVIINNFANQAVTRK